MIKATQFKNIIYSLSFHYYFWLVVVFFISQVFLTFIELYIIFLKKKHN